MPNSAFWVPQKALEGKQKTEKRERHNGNRDAGIEKLNEKAKEKKKEIKNKEERKPGGRWEVGGLHGDRLVHDLEDLRSFPRNHEIKRAWWYELVTSALGRRSHVGPWG